MNSHSPIKEAHQLIATSAVLGILLSAVLFNVLTASAQSGNLFFDGSNFEFEATIGFGDESPYRELCEEAFDDSVFRAWGERVSGIMEGLFSFSLSDILKDLECIKVSALGSYYQGKTCTEERASATEGYLEEAAERDIYYDIITRCTARAVLDRTTDTIINTVRTSGRDGGSTAVQDYTKLGTNAEARGEAIARNHFANTQYCPWIQNQMEALFDFEPSEAVPSSDAVDGKEPYAQRAQCTFPPGTTQEDIAKNPNGIYLLSLPQNNIFGATSLAESEIKRQVSLQVAADSTEAIAGSGHLGIRGANADESCITRDARGTCLAYAPIVQAGAQIVNSLSNVQEAEFDWLTTSDEMGELMGDSYARITQRAVNLTLPDFRFDFEFDPGQSSFLDTSSSRQSSVTRPSSSTSGSGPGGAGSCENPKTTDTCGLPDASGRCECTARPECPGYSTGQSVFRGELADAMGKATAQNPQLFSSNGKLPEGNIAEYVRQVCNQLIQRNSAFTGCRPWSNRSPPASDVIIIPGGNQEWFIDIVRADGAPRIQGPTTKFVCEAGIAG